MAKLKIMTRAQYIGVLGVYLVEVRGGVGHGRTVTEAMRAAVLRAVGTMATNSIGGRA